MVISIMVSIINVSWKYSQELNFSQILSSN